MPSALNHPLWFIVGAITLYQRTLSPDHGAGRGFFPAGVCRFRPTCSEYTKQAVLTHGWYGVWLGIKRLSHCHPLSNTP